MESEYTSHQKFIKVKWESGSEDVHYSTFCDDLPGDIIQNAKREANETEESRAEGIRCLKKFIKKKELICSDDEVLILVLRNCKYDIKKSESKLENFLKVRHMVGDILAKTDIKALEAGMDELGVGIFPYRDIHGRLIFFTRPFENLVTYETDAILAYLLACILFTLSLPMTSLLGITYIADSDCTSIRIWHSLSRAYKQLVSNIANIPLKVGKVEIVKEHFLVRWFYNIIRPFLPQKIAKRVSFLGQGSENLLKIYHRDIIPREFGGNLGPLSDKLYRTQFLDFVQKLKDEHL